MTGGETRHEWTKRIFFLVRLMKRAKETSFFIQSVFSDKVSPNPCSQARSQII